MPDLAKIRHLVLDMDGTLYLGRSLFPQTLPFLETMSRLGIGCSYVTNNCSRSRAEYVVHLREMGIEARPEDVWTSAHATIHYLRMHLKDVKRIFVLGTAGLKDELRQAHYEVVEDRPEVVVVGFDMQLTYGDLANTAYWIKQHLPYVATHPDRVCPTDRPTVLPDCGAFCALLESVTGRRPEAVPGKPNPAMLRPVMDKYGLAPHEVAMVGDRIYTDMRMARLAGAVSVLTLTGEAKMADVEMCPLPERPDLIVADLEELGLLIFDARRAEKKA